METIKLAYSYITDPTDGGVTRTNSTDDDDGDGGGELVRLDQHESYYNKSHYEIDIPYYF